MKAVAVWKSLDVYWNEEQDKFLIKEAFNRKLTISMLKYLKSWIENFSMKS